MVPCQDAMPSIDKNYLHDFLMSTGTVSEIDKSNAEIQFEINRLSQLSSHLN